VCDDPYVQTTINGAEAERPAPRSRRRWLAPLAAVAAAIATVALIQLTRDSEPEESSLSRQLSAQVVQILEQATLAEHAEHGHHFDEEAAGVVCAASTFGFEPPDATTVAEVHTVYAHHMCAEVGPGLSWPEAIRASGPLLVELTDPVTVRLPESVPAGQGATSYADKIRALIPERLHEQALAHDGFVDPEVAGELRQRFEARAG